MSRALTDGERTLAASVFGEAIALDRVRIAAGGFGGFAVTLGSRITVPAPSLRPDYAAESLGGRAWLVHELTHVWQFQTAPGRTLLSWARTVASCGYGPGLPGYRYALPLGEFATYGLERQASIVEHAFTLREHGRSHAMPPGARLEHYAGRTPFLV